MREEIKGGIGAKQLINECRQLTSMAQGFPFTLNNLDHFRFLSPGHL